MEIKVMKITKHKDGTLSIRIPKAFAKQLGMTSGYVNIYVIDNRMIVENTILKASEMVKE